MASPGETKSPDITMVSSDSESQTEVKLQRNMGLVEGVAVIVGIIIGSGIFVSPKGVIQETGSIGVSLIVWIACGILSMIGAQCYAELGTSIPKSGADYAYIHEAFGPLPAFLYLWAANIIFIPTTNAIMALTVTNYIIQPIVGDSCPLPEAARIFLALVFILFFTWLNTHSVKATTRMQNTFMVCKLFALTLICGIGIYGFSTGGYTKFENMFENSSREPSRIAASFYSGLYSYAGWNYLNFMTEELDDPYKNLPRAIYLSLPVVTVLYVVTNIAYLSVLDPVALMSSDAAAVTMVTELNGGPWLSALVTTLVGITTLGSLSCHIMTSSRLCFVGARKGHFPTCLSLINVSNMTPQPALVFLCLLSIFYLLVGDIKSLIEYTAFVETLFILLSMMGMIRLRRLYPDMVRPIKVNLALPTFYIVICCFLIFLPAIVRPWQVGSGLLITCSGVPVYLVFIHWAKKPNWFHNFMNGLTCQTQKLFLATKEE